MLQAEEDLLVLAVQNGSEKAFSLLFEYYQYRLLRFAYKLCQDSEMASDATQDSWIKVAKTIRHLNDPRAFKSYLYRVVHRRVVDLIRQQQRITRLHSKFDSVLSLEGKNKTAEIMEVNCFDESSAIMQAINRLSAIEKQIIHLFYLDEMKLSDISMVVGIPIGTAKSRLNRARKLLKQKFEAS
jgi:RNA polymerase sigma-70 factor (ECF subfamily)